jgi:hypothetical protein
METSNIHQPDCGDVGPVRREQCQLRVFLKQEGVEKLGLGGT